jgi:hypothetical protein
MIKWETGSGKVNTFDCLVITYWLIPECNIQNTPLAIWSTSDDHDCYKLHTAYGTCRFNLFVLLIYRGELPQALTPILQLRRQRAR